MPEVALVADVLLLIALRLYFVGKLASKYQAVFEELGKPAPVGMAYFFLYRFFSLSTVKQRHVDRDLLVTGRIMSVLFALQPVLILIIGYQFYTQSA